jgi:hypothetical protein
LVLVLLATLTIGGCATQAPYRPFKVPESEFVAKVTTIALTPLMLPNDVDDPDAVRAKFEPLIESKLREAGFAIVPPAKVEEIRNQMLAEVGGVFDPKTGKADEAKFKAIREHTYRELASQFNATAVLHSSIEIVKASFNSNTASWHGTTESTSTAQTGFAKVMEGFFYGGRQGQMAALSLGVYIFDMDATELYRQWGGIQLITKVVNNSFVGVPQSDLFQDDVRNQSAVDLALQDLMEAISKPAAPEGH